MDEVYQKIIHKPYIYIKKAADQGLPDALNSIAMMYRNGIGVPQDYSQAL